MLRNLLGTSATDNILWIVFGVNLIVIAAALFINYLWLWLLSFTLSFSLLIFSKYQREKLLRGFYSRKKALRKNKRIRRTQKNFQI